MGPEGPSGPQGESSALNIETVEPNASSTDLKATSAKRLWLMLGNSLSTLLTSNKTIAGAINELFMLINPPKIFILNTLPRNSLYSYIWIDTELWNDSLYWID